MLASLKTSQPIARRIYMFEFDAGQAISEGNIATTEVGTWSDGSIRVVCGLLQVQTTGASTLNVTIGVGSQSYEIPELDLSDADNLIPFVLPVIFTGDTGVTYAAEVTGSDGEWSLTISV
jgi:hypothetical protein